jgi:hypothetical protein
MHIYQYYTEKRYGCHIFSPRLPPELFSWCGAILAYIAFSFTPTVVTPTPGKFIKGIDALNICC